jgi:hypothetical protein
MDNLFHRAEGSKSKVSIPDCQFIINQALLLSWFRVKRASLGNLLPREGRRVKQQGHHTRLPNLLLSRNCYYLGLG